MKRILPRLTLVASVATLAALATPAILHAQTHKLEKLWETDSIIAVPESVLPDATNS